jgi:two-component sensor histidine kinase
LLQEQGHRIKNDLTIATSLMRLQAQAEKTDAARMALNIAADRLTVLAKSQDHLRIGLGDQTTDMQEYLTELCWSLGERLRGIRPIAVEVNAEQVVTKGQKAVRIGLIVNELVTNALKHAFPGDRAGVVAVTLRRCPTGLRLIVQDNGVGCPEGANEGLGSRLTKLLVQQLHGTMAREPESPGCRITISIPPSSAT